MEIKFKEKPSRKRFHFEDIKVGEIFEYGCNIFIKTEELFENYNEYDSMGNAINLETGQLYYIDQEEPVSKYMENFIELEDKFEEWY